MTTANVHDATWLATMADAVQRVIADHDQEALSRRSLLLAKSHDGTSLSVGRSSSKLLSMFPEANRDVARVSDMSVMGVQKDFPDPQQAADWFLELLPSWLLRFDAERGRLEAIRVI